MSRGAYLRILCYDITCNRRRRKVARILEDQASRVQYSVFETRLTAKGVKKLAEEIAAHLDEGDSLRVYTVGRTGERQCRVYGSGVPVETDAGYWLL